MYVLELVLPGVPGLDEMGLQNPIRSRSTQHFYARHSKQLLQSKHVAHCLIVVLVVVELFPTCASIWTRATTTTKCVIERERRRWARLNRLPTHDDDYGAKK